MSEVERAKGGELTSVSLKILYTLHGTDSQKYIVKPSLPVDAVLFRDLELGTVDIRVCLDAIREVSPDFSSICDTHGDEYAVYSTDYAEDGLPLQSHGKVSQRNMIEATGKLGLSKLMREQLELLIHLLPVRKPEDMIADFQQKLKSDSILEPGSSNGGGNGSGNGSSNGNDFQQNHRNLLSFPMPPASFMNPNVLPPLPPQVQIPSSLAPGPSLKSDTVLPSSPPVRAKPTKINASHYGSVMPPPGSASSVSSTMNAGSALSNNPSLLGGNSNTETSFTTPIGNGAAKRASSEQSIVKKRKALSPKAESEAQCGNCGVATASTWRRARCPDGKGELLCNACGLYYRAKKVMRPRFLWDKMRSRSDQENLAGSSIDPLPTTEISSSSSGLMPSQAGLTNSTRLDNAPTPQDTPQMLWSREQTTNYLASDPADISDRLVDNPGHNQHQQQQQLQALESRNQSNHQLPPLLPKSDSVTNQQQTLRPPLPLKKHQSNNTNNAQHQQQQQQEQQHDTDPEEEPLPVVSTPEKKTNFAPLEPDSMQKWLGLSTPDQRLGFMIPGSGSARKWLDKAMNPTHFDEVWNSPTPPKMRSSLPDLTMFTSSPPTSSNMLSEVAEWNLAHGSPGTPQALKFFRGTDTDLDLENDDKKKSSEEYSNSESTHPARTSVDKS